MRSLTIKGHSTITSTHVYLLVDYQADGESPSSAEHGRDFLRSYEVCFCYDSVEELLGDAAWQAWDGWEFISEWQAEANGDLYAYGRHFGVVEKVGIVKVERRGKRVRSAG